MSIVTNQDRQRTEHFEDTPNFYEDEPAAECFAKPNLPKLREKMARMENTSEKTKSTEDERIKIVDGKKWIATLFVPKCFLGNLIGTNRRALNSLENDTQCRVKIPRKEEDKPCEITSFVSLECVQRCLDRIEIFVNDSRLSARVTHFVALPCNQHEIQQAFDSFRQLLLNDDKIDPSCKNPQLFTKPSRLHLTLSVVRILDDPDFKKALDAFTLLENEIKTMFASQPFMAVIEGIDMMNDDPTQVSVIYAKVSGENVQKLADHVNRRLVELGIGAQYNSRETENVKLHMTLMNARYLNPPQSHKKRNEALTFDAKKVLEDFKELHFGTIMFSEICLCPLNSKVSSSEDFYDKLATIKLS